MLVTYWTWPGTSRSAPSGSLPEHFVMPLSDENTLQALRILERNPELSRRELAKELGVSLGKTHYILSSLIDVGLLKAHNFERSDNKLGYAYLLTPQGIAEEAAVTARFLARKRREYKELEQQIADLSSEVELMNRVSLEPDNGFYRYDAS